MKKTNRSMIKTIWLATKDIFSAMPGITILTIVLQLLSASVSIATVSLNASLIDSAGNVTDSSTLLKIVLVLIIGYGVSILFEKLSYKINNIDAVPKFEVFHHKLSKFTVSLSLEAAETPEISTMFWRAKDAIYQDRMGNLFRKVFEIIPGTFRLVGISAVLFSYHPMLVILALVSIIPSIAIRLIYGKMGYELHCKQTVSNRLADYLWGLLTNKDSIKELRTMCSSEYVTNKYFEVQRKVYDENTRFSLKSDFRAFLCDFIKVFFYALSIAFSIYLVNISLITIGAFAACLNAFENMQGISQGMLGNIVDIKNACNYVNDYYDFFNYKTDSKVQKNTDASSDITITARDVSFRYPNADENTINNVNFTIRKGEKIAVVGENGSGKTTFSKLLLGLYRPTSGSITINNVDIHDLGEGYYDRFSLVAQKYGRYSISIRDNIAFGNIRELGNDERLIRASESAETAEVIKELGGFDTELGVEFGGTELSGGQWQKIALARGIFRNSDILLLDEPTSALDPNIEYNILSQFIKMAKDKTAIIISHRIGICRMADRIIVLEGGRIVEDGNHKELIAKHGVYANMWHNQSKWYVEER